MSAVTVERTDGIATVTVDSPPVNAMGREVLGGLEQAAAELAADASVRAVVLTGSGDRAFMAGADINEFGQLLAGGSDAIERHAAWSAGILSAWQRLRQPVVAAAQAHALGGGLEMALACDLIVPDAGARVGLPEVKLGLIPGGGGTQRVTHRIGAAKAKRLIMLGSAMTAQDALDCGLVDVLAPAGSVLAEATAIAAELAALPAVAVQAVKRAIDAVRLDDLGAGIESERAEFTKTFASEDFQEGYAAFLEKRQPAFRHR